MEDDALFSDGKLQDRLTEEDRSKAREIARQIDSVDPNAVMQFGVGIQGKISNFADTILADVKAKDTGHVGKALTDLMLAVRELHVEDIPGTRGILSKVPFVRNVVDGANRFMSRYQSVSTQIVKIVEVLERAKAQLLDDVRSLEGFYEKNREYYKELALYVAAGEMKLAELKDEHIPRLEAAAGVSGGQSDIQKLKDTAALAERLDKKLHDLRLSGMVSLHAGPQIRLVQGNNRELAEKIQTSVLNTIPLWKNQMVLAITLLRQRQSLHLQKEVSETTRELLEKNAEMLKTSSVEIAKESQRGVVDIETLKKVNADLISTIDETMKIQRDGAVRREQARQELERMERQLKEKLLEVRQQKGAAAG